MKTVILNLIQLYKKFFSPVFKIINPYWGCRFYPSCSDYAHQALKNYGLLKGLIMSFKRIIRCNPFNKGGYDPC